MELLKSDSALSLDRTPVEGGRCCVGVAQGSLLEGMIPKETLIVTIGTGEKSSSSRPFLA